jgi:hypothetical protein
VFWPQALHIPFEPERQEPYRANSLFKVVGWFLSLLSFSNGGAEGGGRLFLQERVMWKPLVRMSAFYRRQPHY